MVEWLNGRMVFKPNVVNLRISGVASADGLAGGSEVTPEIRRRHLLALPLIQPHEGVTSRQADDIRFSSHPAIQPFNH
jgi:hypothetical protein